MNHSHPMPVFVIKGKDALAVAAVREYGRDCRRRGLDWQADQVDLAVEEIEAWQQRNADQVKLPDHKHVPVSGSVPVEETTQ